MLHCQPMYKQLKTWLFILQAFEVEIRQSATSSEPAVSHLIHYSHIVHHAHPQSDEHRNRGPQIEKHTHFDGRLGPPKFARRYRASPEIKSPKS